MHTNIVSSLSSTPIQAGNTVLNIVQVLLMVILLPGMAYLYRALTALMVEVKQIKENVIPEGRETLVDKVSQVQRDVAVLQDRNNRKDEK